MSIQKTDITLDGLKHTTEEPMRKAAQLVVENANTFVSENVFKGGAKGDKVVGSAHADGATLTEAESGEIFLESTDAATVTLPATVKGYIYTFIWAGAAGETFNISPNASDKIMGACSDTNAMGTVVESATNGAGADNKDLQLDSGSEIGNRVTLVGDGSLGWYVLDCMGSWAYES